MANEDNYNTMKEILDETLSSVPMPVRRIMATAPATAAKARVYAFVFTGVTATTEFDAYIDAVRLYAASTAGLAYTGDLTYHAQNWKRSSRAVGGYWQGSFRLSSDTLSRAELDDFYNNMLGCRLVETTYGMVSWEGMVWSMDYYQRGSTFRRTLDKNLFHNEMNVWFQDDDGNTAYAGPTTNSDSIDEYGTCKLIATIGKANVASAECMRDTHLEAYAWPRSREVGTHTFAVGDVPSNDYITVTVAGYWHTLNWAYRTGTATGTPNAIFAALLTAVEFVTEGRIETNASSVRVADDTMRTQVGDAMAQVIYYGDVTGGIWQGGVYAGRRFNYKVAPTGMNYQYRDGRLLDKAGQDVVFPLLEAGFLLFNASAPTGGQPPGTSNIYDNPRYRYVEEVEFTAPDTIALKFSALDKAVIIERRTRGGDLG